MIGRLSATELATASRLLVRAFADDPLFAYMFPDRGRRARALHAMFKAAVRDGLTHGLVNAFRSRETVTGVALWLPPGAWPPSMLRNLRQLPAFATAAVLFPGSVGTVARTLAADSKAHIDEPHWYLQLVGVEPSCRGRGIGTALLDGVLAAADEDRMPCFLVTSNPRNLGWYGHLGFEPTGSIRIHPASPPFWPMRRDPRPQASVV